MKILPDGTVEIRNKKTGQAKVVQPNDLPSYGIPYSEFETQLKSFKNIGGETTISSPESQKVKDAKVVKEELVGKAQGLLDVLDAGKSFVACCKKVSQAGKRRQRRYRHCRRRHNRHFQRLLPAAGRL